ncbi:hypothetical protein P7K49_035271 [Saguinus oedipus]|uniref:Protein Wnt n=1 Tax=Saguinus oedipus TaxID=9490 RepID=A0ABQ9TM50_SAGOE|nr:hypothetical protein P7K49_035271 [Saguinus oedipus]
MRWSPRSRSGACSSVLPSRRHTHRRLSPSQYSSLGSQPILCASIPGLVPKQLRFCRNYVEIMPSVAEGIKISIQECQHQFRGRRWNCTTVHDSLAIFGPVLDKGQHGLERDGGFRLLLPGMLVCAHRGNGASHRRWGLSR